jgi:hypothetical protein
MRANRKWMILEKMMDTGMTDRGNADFFISDRSNTMLDVVLLRDDEKKFHARSPINR